MRPSSQVLCSLVSLPLLVLTGCSLSSTADPSAAAGLPIQGRVHGGQQAIVGAHVYLLAANTTGNAGPGIAASSSNASVSLLNSAKTGNSDSVGAYVLTDSTGSFTITGDYSCTPNTQVYAYVLGGNPGVGGGPNPASGLMAAIGNCPSSGSFITAAPFIWVNEVSTVAAAYAMAGYATDALHVSSSGTTQAKLGLANAFINAAVLETLSTGTANQFPPALPTGSGGGSVPQSEINTLGNILAACVNSTGAITGPSSPTACYTLFTNAMSSGTSGTQPTDTATAAINIAHNPAAAVAALYNMSSAYAQFSPALTAQPNDFTMAVYYNDGLFNQGGPLAVDATNDLWIASGSVTEINGQGYDFTGGNGESGFYGVQWLSIDPNGNVWGVNNTALGEFSSTGAFLSPSGGYTTGLGISQPTGLAMDASANAWIADAANKSVIKVTSGGALSGTFTGSGLVAPEAIAIDPSGNAWVADNSSGAIVELSPTGTPLSGSGGYTGVGLNSPTGIAIDHSGNVWVSNSGSPYGSVTEISKTGALVSPSGGYTNGASLSNPRAIAIDGAGNAWLAGVTAISEISPAGTFLSGANGYTSNDGISGIGIDASGNVWVNYDSFNFLFGYTYYEQILIGAATPVVTPIAAGVKNNTLGTRP